MSLADTLVRSFAEDHPVEAARILGEHPADVEAALLARWPEGSAASVLGRMPPPVGAECLGALEPSHGAALLARLPAEDAVALLRRIEPARREAILAELPDAARLRPLLVHREDTAAALMDPNALALPDDLELDEVRRRLGRHAAHLALEVYVVDSEQRLRGVADLRELLDVSRRGPLASVVRPVEPLSAGADAGVLFVHPGWTEHDSIPVVDERGVYLGAVRHERLRRLLLAATGERRGRGGLEAVVALGELYWLGLSGLFTGLASQRPRTDRTEGES
jgi:Mg/Co/Ni transporter MgtE